MGGFFLFPPTIVEFAKCISPLTHHILINVSSRDAHHLETLPHEIFTRLGTAADVGETELLQPSNNQFDLKSREMLQVRRLIHLNILGIFIIIIYL